MIKKQYYLLLLTLLYFGLTACKKKVEADYEAALEKGKLLVENDTVIAELNKPLFFKVAFADGVNPIHYKWELYQQDTQKIRSLDWQEFHFSSPDMVGGSAKGLLSFEPVATGLHRLVFYRPFMSIELYQREQAAQDPYLIWKKFQQEFLGLDSVIVKRADFEMYWIALQEAYGVTKDSLWTNLQEFTHNRDSLIDSLAQANLLQEWATDYNAYNSPLHVLELLDSLLGGKSHYIHQAEFWHNLRSQQDKNPLPLHPKANTKTYYVRVKK